MDREAQIFDTLVYALFLSILWGSRQEYRCVDGRFSAKIQSAVVWFLPQTAKE